MQFASVQSRQESDNEFFRGVCVCMYAGTCVFVRAHIEGGWVGHVRGRERQKEDILRRMVHLIIFEI